jgi:hypothetical protein
MVKDWLRTNGWLLFVTLLGVLAAAYGILRGGIESSGWVVAGATVVYVGFTYRVIQLNQQAVAATWQLVQETQVDRYLAHTPRLTLGTPFAHPWQTALVVYVRNLAAAAAAENVSCDAWGMVSGGQFGTSQPAASRRYYSVGQGVSVGPNETVPVLMFKAEEGVLGPIAADLERAEGVLASFEAERGFRPTPGTFICEIRWDSQLGAANARQFQVFVGAPLPEAAPPAGQQA